MFFLLMKYLPEKTRKVIVKAAHGIEKDIVEIRIRADKKICISDGGTMMFAEGYIPKRTDVENIVMAMCDHALFSHINEIREGFLTLACGIRAGVCGTFVYDSGKIVNIRDFSGITIRLPHDIKALCPPISDCLAGHNNKILPTLIISPPGAGKTTLLRDIVRCVSSGNMFLRQNVCVIDERFEICGVKYPENSFQMGDACDVLSGVAKKDGIGISLRAMAPQVIATDELDSMNDAKAVYSAANSGVTVIATMHAGSFEEACRKKGFSLLKLIFKRYILLNDSVRKGHITDILDNSGAHLYKGGNSL